MAEIRFDGQPATWLRVFPWLRLFRVFRIACDPKKIFFGAIGALLMSLGWWGHYLVGDLNPERTNDRPCRLGT